MRILIVGGGIAGLTLAGLLYRRGIHPVVVEKTEAYGNAGYFLSLWPLGSRVLWGLDAYAHYAKVGTAMPDYFIYDFEGQLLRRYALGNLFQEFGDMYLLTRAQLLDILRAAAPDLPLRMGTTVGALSQTDAGVQVEFSDGESGEYDLVVGADGLHSRIRGLVFGDVPLTDTGWGGWMWWADGLEGEWPASEFWGRGRYAGFARVDGRVGAVVGMPFASDFQPSSVEPEEYLAHRLGASMPAPVAQLLPTLENAAEPTFLRLSDIRMTQWYKGRVLLLGDAGAGFLPTAGVGASMAMESAAVLNDELQRVDAARIPQALAMFVKRRRKRVDAIQDESRRLARLMFTRSRLLAWGSRQLLRYYARPEQLLRQITAYMNEPI